MRTVLVLIALSVAGVEATATAQSCTEGVGAVAHVATNGARVTIKLAGFIPKVNNVSCGFAASSIEVVGVAGTDTVILNYVPPGMPVSLDLGAGTNNLTIYESEADDIVTCTHGRIDRDGDGGYDLDVGDGPLAMVTMYGRGGNDVIDCSRFDYKVKIFGEAGDDDLYGGVFDDTLNGGDGDDLVSGGAGDDRIDVGLGNDVGFGDDGNDTFLSKSTHDGRDTFYGNFGTDVLNYANRTVSVVLQLNPFYSEDQVGDDIETIKGGKVSDMFDFQNASVSRSYYGGPGNDWIRGGTTGDAIYGQADNDYLSPGPGPDAVIDAGAGNDFVVWPGDAHAETVKCGAGIDNYIGSPEDTFVSCEEPDGVDLIGRIAAGYWHACAIVGGNGEVKCWGGNPYGELGQGTTANRGATPGDMGASLPATDLGTGATAYSITARGHHTCVLLNGGSVKCWGSNIYGQLGVGDTANRGDAPGEMGDALPAVALGSGRYATAIASGGDHTCAILDNGSVKCWGRNDVGQLGIGDIASHGDGFGEMGDWLPAVDLGTGRTATSIDANYYHTCAVLDDGNVKCWGWGAYLGQGDITHRGDQPGEMGDALPPIALGTGRHARAVSVGTHSACAILDDRTVKCWGAGLAGQLGYGDSAMRGDDPGEMGDALPVVQLGGQKVMAIASNAYNRCAVLANATVKCWGWNQQGSAGQGTLEAYGDQPGELAAMLPVPIGSAQAVDGVAAGGEFNCASLQSGKLKCWGSAAFGQLGLEDGVTRGDGPGEMGDALPFVEIGGPLSRAPDPTPAHATAESVEAPIAGDEDDHPLDDEADPEIDDDADDVGGCSSSRGGGASSVALVLAIVAGVRRRRAALQADDR